MVEYDSLVVKKMFSSPGFPTNVDLLSCTSLGTSAPYHVMIGLGTVAISDTLGSYSVFCCSFWYVDVPMLL